MGRRQIWSRFERVQALAAPFPSLSRSGAALNCTFVVCFIRESVQRPGAEQPPRFIGRPLQFMPAAVWCIAFSASSSVKVLGFWMGGKSLKVAAH
jgi:hypothetical protein